VKKCIVNFSGRRKGNCYDIARLIEQLLMTDHEVTLLDMCDLTVNPCGKCGYECFRENKTCPFCNDSIAHIYQSIYSSDEAYYIVPNYSDYPNAFFFIFNERSQGIFTHQPPELYEQYLRVNKKFVVISSTEEDNFKHTFSYHIQENTEADILFLSAKIFDINAVKDKLMDVEQAKQMVVNFIRNNI